MTQEPDIKRALRTVLDPIEESRSMPPSVQKRATRRRWLTNAGGFLGVVMIGAGVAAGVASLEPPTRAALPSSQQLRDEGFAVWPEDTLQEGLEACGEAEGWRFDAHETADRYAREVLGYPEPHLRAADRKPSSVQYGITSEAVELGSIIHLRKYDRCWFVVYVTAREGGFIPSLLFAYDEGGDPLLVIEGIGHETEVGYGEWETLVDASEQAVVDPPDLPPNATGHIARIFTSKGISDIDAVRLGSIPRPATIAVRPLAPEELRETEGICPGGEGFGSPEAALASLYRAAFGKGIPQHGRVHKFRGGNEIERVAGEEWRLRVGGAELRATVPEVKKSCWGIASVEDPSGNLLNDLKVAEDAFTFDIAWGDATAAEIILANDRGGDSWTVERLKRPLTVSGLDTRNPLKERFRVNVVLRKSGRIVAAQQFWYEAR